jgi:hypothetical protein
MHTNKKNNIKLIGEVVNQFSNLVISIIADAQYSWLGDASSEYETLSNKMFDTGKPCLPIDKNALLINVGGCGTAKIFQLSPQEFIIVGDFRETKWNQEVEQAYLNAVQSPNSKQTKKVGTVQIKSKGLIIGHAPDEITIKKVPTKTIQKYPWGIFIEILNGEYDVFRDDTELSGSFGDIESRYRIIKKGAKPANIPKTIAPKKEKKTNITGTALKIDGLNLLIHSLAYSADGNLLVAGEKGGDRIIAWNEKDKVQWIINLKPKKEYSDVAYLKEVKVLFHPKQNIIVASYLDELFFIDPTTGKQVKKSILIRRDPLKFGEFINAFNFDLIGKKLFVLVIPYIHVYDMKSQKKLQTLENEFPSAYTILVSTDVLIILGRFTDFISPKNFAVQHTIKPKDYANNACLSEDQKLAASVHSNGDVILWDVEKKCMNAKFSGSKLLNDNGASSVAFSKDSKYVIAGYEDGAVHIIDIKKKKIVTKIFGHDTTKPDTGARSLDALCMHPNGKQLVVSATTPTNPGAVTRYDFFELINQKL